MRVWFLAHGVLARGVLARGFLARGFLACAFLAAAPLAATAQETFSCQLPSLVGGTAQTFRIRVEPSVIRRLAGPDGSGGSLPAVDYPVLKDDGNTAVAAVTEFPPEVTMVIFVRTSGLFKIMAFTNEAQQDRAFFASCVKG